MCMSELAHRLDELPAPPSGAASWPCAALLVWRMSLRSGPWTGAAPRPTVAERHGCHHHKQQTLFFASSIMVAIVIVSDHRKQKVCIVMFAIVIVSDHTQVSVSMAMS